MLRNDLTLADTIAAKNYASWASKGMNPDEPLEKQAQDMLDDLWRAITLLTGQANWIVDPEPRG